MWLGNILNTWNQYTDSTGGEIFTQNKDKHDMDIISVKDDNFTLLYVQLAYTKHVNYAHRFAR